eukprot:TRINITY_DN10951_c0_g1_i2.p1 TRINITY_DN10951_c0_g1~~TRINITY_DN10951_c0_g1_i2.p1  ORF type:complete len:228 (+),score=41.93 TRINITY_DN10951_c0_g1_i2:26-709(+)
MIQQNIITTLCVFICWGIVVNADVVQLSKLALRTCLKEDVYDFDCDLTTNPLLYRGSTLPGVNSIVNISGTNGLNFTMGESFMFGGLLLDKYSLITIDPGVKVIFMTKFEMGEKSTIRMKDEASIESYGLCNFQQMTLLNASCLGTSLTCHFGLSTKISSQVIMGPRSYIEISASSLLLSPIIFGPGSDFTVAGGNVTYPNDFFIDDGNFTLRGLFISKSFSQNSAF